MTTTPEQVLALCRRDPSATAKLICELSAGFDRLETEFAVLKAEKEALKTENQALRNEVQRLKEQVAKNSRNSSKPPSSDGYAKPAPKSLRKPSGRPAGGQKGHKGHALCMVENPDKIVPHTVLQCERCGRSPTIADRRDHPQPSRRGASRRLRRDRHPRRRESALAAHDLDRMVDLVLCPPQAR